MGRGRAGRAVLIGLVAGGLVLFVLRSFVLEIDRVTSPSMAPTLLVGDWILVNRLDWRRQGPYRGEVVVFRAPDGEKTVKRILGLPGDTVTIDAAGIQVNGALVAHEILREVTLDAVGAEVHRAIALPERTLEEERLGQARWQVVRLRSAHPEPGTWTVPAKALFVLGDNREASVDSRHPEVGMVPESAVVGRVSRVLHSAVGGDRPPEQGLAVP